MVYVHAVWCMYMPYGVCTCRIIHVTSYVHPCMIMSMVEHYNTDTKGCVCFNGKTLLSSWLSEEGKSILGTALK